MGASLTLHNAGSCAKRLPWSCALQRSNFHRVPTPSRPTTCLACPLPLCDAVGKFPAPLKGTLCTFLPMDQPKSPDGQDRRYRSGCSRNATFDHEAIPHGVTETRCCLKTKQEVCSLIARFIRLKTFFVPPCPCENTTRSNKRISASRNRPAGSLHSAKSTPARVVLDVRWQKGIIPKLPPRPVGGDFSGQAIICLTFLAKLPK